MSNAVPEKAHATLGASVASRWMACPGSVRLSRDIPPSASTTFAQEGTAAHALAELCLRRGVPPETFVGTTLEGIEVTDEMAEHVSVYVDYCALWMGEGYTNDGPMPKDQYWVERKFTLADLHPPGPMFGTADFVAYEPDTRTLHVVDLKYGMGVVVEAKGNKQLRYYGLGAALSMPKGTEIEQVTMTIVQPRAAHPEGMVRSETIPYHELVEYAAELMDAAKATTEPDAPLHPGSHCRFCPASGVCPAQLAQAQSIAQVEFDTLPLDVPPDPETLPPAVFADILGKLHILEDWATAVRAAAFRRLENGEDVPGFKLVAKRATRSWADESETAQWLTAQGREPDEIYVQKVRSPAQIEKLVGKKNLPADLVVKQSSGYRMAPAHDPAPAISLAKGDEFRALPVGDND